MQIRAASCEIRMREKSEERRERESCLLAEANTVWPNETYNLLIQNQKNAACLAHSLGGPSQEQADPRQVGHRHGI